MITQDQPNFINRLNIPRKGLSGFDETRASILKDLESITTEQINAIDKEINKAEKEKTEKHDAEQNSFIDKYRAQYLNNIDGVSNKNSMVSRFNQLLKTNELKIHTDNIGRHIALNGLNYDICILNLGNGTYNQPIYQVSMNNASKTDFINKGTFETNIDGMNEISKTLINGYIIPNENEIKEILRKLKLQFNDIISSANKTATGHDEDIAFFMLLTQCYGEFLLKDNQVFKCYDKFRGFKPVKPGKTGQIMTIRKIG